VRGSGTLGSRTPQHEDDPYQGCAEAHAGAEKLHNVDGAIQLETCTLGHPVKSEETDQQWNDLGRDSIFSIWRRWFMSCPAYKWTICSIVSFPRSE